VVSGWSLECANPCYQLCSAVQRKCFWSFYESGGDGLSPFDGAWTQTRESRADDVRQDTAASILGVRKRQVPVYENLPSAHVPAKL
jgi:hypothetical protein